MSVDTTQAPATAAEQFAMRQQSPLQRVQQLLHSHPALSPLMVLIVAFIVFTIINPRFAAPGTLSIILQQTAVIAALAVGQTLVILTAGIDLAVGPALWWAESNWRNRFTIPVTFGLPPDTCDVLDSRAPTGFYGSELLAQAEVVATPVSAALTAFDPERATASAIVAIDVNARSATAQPQSKQQLFLVEMIRTPDGWKAAKATPSTGQQ